MALRKSPNNLTAEELLEQLSITEVTPEELRIKEENEHSVIDFIRFFNIQSGEHKIISKSLYKLYKLWFKYDEILNSRIFHLELGKYITKVHTNGFDYYLVNKKLMDLDERGQSLIKEKKRYKSPVAKAHFDRFLSKYNITNGTKYNFIWLNSDVLYSLYDEYTYNIKKVQPLAETQFIKMCKIYFPDYKKDADTLWFNIHDSIKTIMTTERISVIMTGRSQRRAKKTKKQKKQNQTSGSET